MDVFQSCCCAETPVLPDHAPWNGLSEICKKDLLETATRGYLVRGEEARSDVCIVLSGALAVERELSDGRRVLCALFHQGDLIDLRRSERIRQGRLIALKDSELLNLNEEQVDDCTHAHNDLANAFMGQQGNHFARMRDHTTDLASKTPFERMASVIFEFKRWPDSLCEQKDGNSVRIPILRIDIADYIGVKPETVSRAIRKLERERRIAIPEPDRIFLIDIPAMRQIANGGRPRQSRQRA